MNQMTTNVAPVVKGNPLLSDARVSDEELALVPADGALIVVVDKRFDTIDALLVGNVLRRVRKDVRILAHAPHLSQAKNSDLFIRVSTAKPKALPRKGSEISREAIRWVRNGGVLVVFRSRELKSLLSARAEDSANQRVGSVSRLCRLLGARILPLAIEGVGGLVREFARFLPGSVRHKLIQPDLLQKARRSAAVRIGPPLDVTKLAAKGDDRHLLEYVALCLAMLRSRGNRKMPLMPAATAGLREAMAVAEPVSPDLLVSEVNALGTHRRLADAGELSVFLADGDDIPWVLREIGRLRELTFRATGEGTGNARDIDFYDAYYKHLFVWNHAKGELVGAYRLGMADEIMDRFGKRGLYTHSLFRYRTRLLKELGPAIELGRSFVRQEYQRNFSPLMLLWKGIGRFVADNPRYTVLFGPVSISSEYETVSQQLMVEFLRSNTSDRRLSRYVRPRHPFRSAGPLASKKYGLGLDMNTVSELISRNEADHKGVPILLKQYLKLGGQILGFNIDPDFNDALDGLIMVDLRQADPKILAKYMGREETARFLDQAAGLTRKRA